MIPNENFPMQELGNYPDYPTGAKGENTLERCCQNNIESKHLEKWYDNYEVTKMFHISQRTLQTLRSNGKLPLASTQARSW